MRRMITNKQIDDIEQGAVLDQYIKPSAPILPLPEVPDVLIFNQYIDDFAESVEAGDYSVDFDSHKITEWYPEIEDSNHFAGLYFEMTDPIAFPEEIETVEELAQWIKTNWQTIIYTAVLEDKSMYQESSEMTSDYAYVSLDYDTDDAEYESDGIHLEINGVGYTSTYLRNSQLSFGVDGNLKINGLGEINTNQTITSTNTITAKNLISNNDLKCRGILYASKIRAEGFNDIELGHVKMINSIDANNNDIINVADLKTARIKAKNAPLHPYVDLKEPDETYTHGRILFHTDIFVLDGIPTSDPHVAGAVWNDSGVLKISSGS